MTATISIRSSKGAPSTTEFKKLRKRIVRYVREAIEQYGMIERDARDPNAPPVRWLVCLSGGKDSYTLLAALYELKWRGLLAGRSAGLQPRSGAARISGDGPAKIP